MSDNIQIKKKNEKKTGMWPVYGLFTAVAAGGIAYVLAPRVMPILGLTGNELPDNQMLLVVMLVLFLILVTLFSLVLAIFIPKNPMHIKENDLRKEKQVAQQRKLASQKRQRELARQQRKNTKDISEFD
jgi:hypothetical protein